MAQPGGINRFWLACCSCQAGYHRGRPPPSTNELAGIQLVGRGDLVRRDDTKIYEKLPQVLQAFNLQPTVLSEFKLLLDLSGRFIRVAEQLI